MIFGMSQIKISRLNDDQINELGILSWPIWEKEVSRFSWTYSENEQCYIIDGEFTVETEHGNFNVVKGDYVQFEKGLSCVWNISRPVKKYYNFS